MGLQATCAWGAALCLLGLLLVGGAYGEEQKPLSGEALDKKIEENVETQDYLREKGTQVIAQIIKQEQPAEVASGTGDVSVTGALQVFRIPDQSTEPPPGVPKFLGLFNFWGGQGGGKSQSRNAPNAFCNAYQGSTDLRAVSVDPLLKDLKPSK